MARRKDGVETRNRILAVAREEQIHLCGMSVVRFSLAGIRRIREDIEAGGNRPLDAAPAPN